MMEPIPLTFGSSERPESYILPIRCEPRTPSSPPVPVEWWQWMPAPTSGRSQWVRVTVYGEGD